MFAVAFMLWAHWNHFVEFDTIRRQTDDPPDLYQPGLSRLIDKAPGQRVIWSWSSSKLA